MPETSETIIEVPILLLTASSSFLPKFLATKTFAPIDSPINKPMIRFIIEPVQDTAPTSVSPANLPKIKTSAE